MPVMNPFSAQTLDGTDGGLWKHLAQLVGFSLGPRARVRLSGRHIWFVLFYEQRGGRDAADHVLVSRAVLDEMTAYFGHAVARRWPKASPGRKRVVHFGAAVPPHRTG
jgi:hypothetical protein